MASASPHKTYVDPASLKKRETADELYSRVIEHATPPKPSTPAERLLRIEERLRRASPKKSGAVQEEDKAAKNVVMSPLLREYKNR